MQFKPTFASIMGVLALAGPGSTLPAASGFPASDPMVTLFLLPNYNKALGTNAAWLSSIFQWTTPTDACFGKCYPLPTYWNDVTIGSVWENPTVGSCWIYPSGTTDCSGTNYKAVNATTPTVSGQDPNFAATGGSVVCVPWTT